MSNSNKTKKAKVSKERAGKKSAIVVGYETTPELAQNCHVCGELTNKIFSVEGTKQSVRACSEEHALEFFTKKNSVETTKKSTHEEPAKEAAPKRIAPRRQAVADVIKKLGKPTMETILEKTPKFSNDPKKDKHATSDTVFRMWAYDELLKKEGKGKTARYSFSAKGKEEFGIK